jgi:murein DD-endopeptidase MepM/ murein hydrolase activator NlpD
VPALIALLAAMALAFTSLTATASADGVGFELKDARVTPGQAFFGGKEQPEVKFRFDARRPVSLKILVVKAKSGRTVARLREPQAQPGKRVVQSWNGLTESGDAAGDGRYEFRIGPVGKGPARFAGGFRLRGHAFPVDGPHGTRGAIGEFGADRNGGRTHEGFDITADCGTPLVAARGGKVARVGYDPELYGYFVLINGTKTNESYFYSHLIEASPFGRGDRIRTRDLLGRVGQTGNAASTPCHLHFELRVNGNPVNPKPHLRRWDRYS